MNSLADKRGFTIVEMVVALAVSALVLTVAITFFNTSVNQYLSLQAEGVSISELAIQTQHLASVMRGATDIILASNTEMTLYTYFSPNDAYISQVHYYKSADGTRLLADVTPFSTNPPGGTLLTNQLKTYAIVDNFYTKTGVNTFEYIDSSGGTMTLPITELHTIKGIRINLISKPPRANDTLSVQVSLRNRKTNL